MTHRFAPSASWPMLRLRAELLARIRAFFANRGFLEVETPLLAPEVILDAHIEPIAVANPARIADSDSPSDERWYLQSSPEAHMKRLLAAGAPAIYQVTRSFRRGEIGRLHNPEFTIVEWYRPADGMAAGMQLLAELVNGLLELPSAKCVSYAAAFGQHIGIDPHLAAECELRDAAAGIADEATRAELTRDDLLNLLLVEKVEPHLGYEQPEILHSYPASQAALAIVNQNDPPVAERFELYIRGVELANGYHELCDADELRRRMNDENTRRAKQNQCDLPLPERLFEAMECGLPACTGVALGFDRLAMLAAGADSLAEIVAFPLGRVQ